MPVFAAFYYWVGMTSKRPLSERLGKWIFWLFFAGVHITFLPMHLTGLMGMPRRVYTYLPENNWEWTNLVSTAGAFVLGLAVLLFLVDLARNFRFTVRSEEHTSELQSLMRTSYAVFCLTTQKHQPAITHNRTVT